MHDARSSMRGLEPERKAAIVGAVEAHAEPREPQDRGGRGAGEFVDDRGVAEAVAGGERVGGVQSRAVARAHRGGQTALRPEGRALGAERTLGQHDDRPGRKLERRHQAGDPCADDDDAPAERQDLGAHSASILSTARRAGAAIDGIDRHLAFESLERVTDLGERDALHVRT